MTPYVLIIQAAADDLDQVRAMAQSFATILPGMEGVEDPLSEVRLTVSIGDDMERILETIGQSPPTEARHWKNEVPSEPGWYWHRKGPGEKVQGVRQFLRYKGNLKMEMKDGRETILVEPGVYNRYCRTVEWAGPFFPPRDRSQT